LEAEQRAADEAASKVARKASNSNEESEDDADDTADELSPSEDEDEAARPPPSEEEEESDDEIILSFDDDVNSDDAKDPRTKVLSVLELEDLFKNVAPDLASKDTFCTYLPATELTLLAFAIGDTVPDKLVVGLVGYPNVGKSSTINALIGEKKVSVSSTPGKTKHFQTIHLSSDIILCDCPGLVFPQFATTKADLVCDGVLPIDQLREHTGPVALLVKRIPKNVLEATYGLTLKTRDFEDGGDGQVLPEDLLVPYASDYLSRFGQGSSSIDHACSRSRIHACRSRQSG
jgi:large subunit GTPase 1